MNIPRVSKISLPDDRQREILCREFLSYCIVLLFIYLKYIVTLVSVFFRWVL